MESVWYYAHDGAQTGPVSFGDLRAAVASGQLVAEDLVWKEGTVDWHKMRFEHKNRQSMGGTRGTLD